VEVARKLANMSAPSMGGSGSPGGEEE